MKDLIESIRQMYQPQAEATMMKNSGEVVHNCAKHVEHAEYGRGATIAEEHADPDRYGNIAWYDVVFEHGIERGVPVTELSILQSESHGHSTKKAKKMAEEEDLSNAKKNGKMKDDDEEEEDDENEMEDDDEDKPKKMKNMKEAVKPQSKDEKDKVVGAVQAAMRKSRGNVIAGQAQLAAARMNAKIKAGMKEHIEFSMTVEEFDQLDELSKKTLGSYVKKAKDHAVGLGVGLGVAAMKRRDRSDVADKLSQRTKNINKAVDRITNEEVALDEKEGQGSSDPLANRADYAKRHGTGQVYKKTHAGDKTGMTKSYAYDIKRSGPKGKLPEEVNFPIQEDHDQYAPSPVDETIITSTKEYDISEAQKSAGYDAHFRAMMTKHGVKHPGELDTPEKKKAFFNKVDASYKAKNEDVFLEAMMASDLQKIKDAHRGAGNKISDETSGSKGGEAHHSFVVTQPSGKRTRHIYHGKTKKVETMSPAPRSKESAEQDLDDK